MTKTEAVVDDIEDHIYIYSSLAIRIPIWLDMMIVGTISISELVVVLHGGQERMSQLVSYAYDDEDD